MSEENEKIAAVERERERWLKVVGEIRAVNEFKGRPNNLGIERLSNEIESILAAATAEGK